jgi:hypothetical protein
MGCFAAGYRERRSGKGELMSTDFVNRDSGVLFPRWAGPYLDGAFWIEQVDETFKALHADA